MSNLKNELGLRVERRAVRDSLLRATESLYQAGYKSLPPSQMAAIRDYAQGAASVRAAIAKVIGFIRDQLEKLDKEQERGLKPRSWAKPVQTGGEGKNLGERLIAWLGTRCYLGTADENHPLWNDLPTFHLALATLLALHRYEQATGKSMALNLTHHKQEAA